MDSGLWLNIGLVLLFILIGGLFAGTEMAIVNLRQSQIEAIEATGPRGEKIGRLVRNPNLFLSAVQIGVTVAGFFSSAFGASTIAPAFVPWLESLGMSTAAADLTAVIGLTLIIAYLSLVLGELVPKRLAMQNAVKVTKVVAPPLNAFARLMRPVIWLLSVSTNAVVRLLGGDPKAHKEAVSAEEIRAMVTTSDAISEANRRILQDVFDAAERTLVEVMRPRTDVNFLDGDDTIEVALHAAHGLPNSRYPVYGEDADDILGFVHLRDLMRVEDRQRTIVRAVTRPIVMFPGTVHVLRAINIMRAEGHQIAIVVDEYGGTDGIVTMEDLMEEIVGEIYDEYDVSPGPEDSVLKSAGVIEVDGGLILQEFAASTGIELPDDGSYQTVGGYIMAVLGRVAVEGDAVPVPGFELRVITVDRHRIARVRVERVEDESVDAEGAGNGAVDEPGETAVAVPDLAISDETGDESSRRGPGA
ncbi:MAG TPA: hemolysin family protein [Actinomycetaceae bacterium]|nr:hemolysin family protein [Actinomycetaceae bacterium]